jgi:hypothetical protein
MPPQFVYPHLRSRATQDELLIAIRDFFTYGDTNTFIFRLPRFQTPSRNQTYEERQQAKPVIP